MDAVFVLDAEQPTRVWPKILGINVVPCTWCFDSLVPIARSNNSPCENGIVLVHFPHFCDAAFVGTKEKKKSAATAELCRLASARRDLIVIAVSGNGESDEMPVESRLYFRKSALADDDRFFGERFNTFRNRVLTGGSVSFELLEPDRVPDELLSIYIASISTKCCDAESDIITPEMHAETWAIAKAQLERLGKKSTLAWGAPLLANSGELESLIEEIAFRLGGG